LSVIPIFLILHIGVFGLTLGRTAFKIRLPGFELLDVATQFDFFYTLKIEHQRDARQLPVSVP
jgi:hypothetical protein